MINTYTVEIRNQLTHPLIQALRIMIRPVLHRGLLITWTEFGMERWVTLRLHLLTWSSVSPENYSSVTYQTGTLYVTPTKGYQTITISSICIVDRGSIGADGFRYVARFTYNSNNWPSYIYIPLGTDNMLVSDGGNAGFCWTASCNFQAGKQ